MTAPSLKHHDVSTLVMTQQFFIFDFESQDFLKVFEHTGLFLCHQDLLLWSDFGSWIVQNQVLVYYRITLPNVLIGSNRLPQNNPSKHPEEKDEHRSLPEGAGLRNGSGGTICRSPGLDWSRFWGPRSLSNK